MSSIYRKIGYVEEGAYGSTVKRTLYTEFNATTYSVHIKDDNGNTVLWYGEWGMGDELDMGQAIVKLLTVETDSMTVDEITNFKK